MDLSGAHRASDERKVLALPDQNDGAQNIEGQRAYITELDARLFDEAALALQPIGRSL